jgi:hypothetical protein
MNDLNHALLTYLSGFLSSLGQTTKKWGDPKDPEAMPLKNEELANECG